jgi:dihydrofolate synthase/folylpolyglutamate synthase
MRFPDLAQWLRWQEGLHPNAIDLGLQRVTNTLQRLGWRRPHCPVITVGGTNGKGSSVALLESMLTCAGYRVGCFTSPHLRSYNERIKCNGRQVSNAVLMEAFARIDAARQPDTLTFFEFNTLAALLCFEREPLDAVILEVGMGGRLDAVNVVDADVALVSSIALDHCQWLGSDVQAIGREKAGIFRGGRPAVFGSREMPRSIAEVAQQVGAQLLQLGVDFDYQRREHDWDWFNGVRRFEGLPPPALAGEVQFANAAAVLAVLDCLRERLPMPPGALEHGLREVTLPGRFQRLGSAPEWIVDVAHNPAAAQTLAAQLAEQRTCGKTLAVASMLGDKDIEGIARMLHGRIDAWIVGGLRGERAAPVEEVARRLQAGGAHVVAAVPSITQACETAQQQAAASDRIIAFGSFLTVAEVMDWFDTCRGPGTSDASGDVPKRE